MVSKMDALMRRHSRFHNSRDVAIRDARQRGGVVVQVIRGRQWLAASGAVVIRESMERMRESAAYLGKAPPKIVADFRR